MGEQNGKLYQFPEQASPLQPIPYEDVEAVVTISPEEMDTVEMQLQFMLDARAGLDDVKTLETVIVSREAYNLPDHQAGLGMMNLISLIVNKNEKYRLLNLHTFTALGTMSGPDYTHRLYLASSLTPDAEVVTRSARDLMQYAGLLLTQLQSPLWTEKAEETPE
jgi:hypothetical protein